jgi:hypothetical protein
MQHEPVSALHVSPAQHARVAHDSPAIEQAQTPPSQLPVQHSALVVQFSYSRAQQAPLWHSSLRAAMPQSHEKGSAPSHGEPGTGQQRFSDGLHTMPVAGQQSASDPQNSPRSTQHCPLATSHAWPTQHSSFVPHGPRKGWQHAKREVGSQMPSQQSSSSSQKSPGPRQAPHTESNWGPTQVIAPQQSVGTPQSVPASPQQVPETQREPAQQSPSTVQGSPGGKQPPRGPHTPPHTKVGSQQSSADTHAPSSGTHAHVPPTQVMAPQQSVSLVHASFWPAQSHRPERHA